MISVGYAIYARVKPNGLRKTKTYSVIRIVISVTKERKVWSWRDSIDLFYAAIIFIGLPILLMVVHSIPFGIIIGALLWTGLLILGNGPI